MTERFNVAEAFPARRQPDGRTYYRAFDAHEGRNGRLGDGWTDNLALAHPDYRAEGAPEPLCATLSPEQPLAGVTMPEIVSVTFSAAPEPPPHNPEEITVARRKQPDGLDENFEPVAPVRVTQYMHYPLPPESPRAASEFGQWGWYKLPNPETGRPTIYPRATTIAKTLEEQSNLTKWKIRERAMQVLQLSRMDPATVIYTDPTGPTTAADALGALDDAMKSGKAYAIDGVLEMIDNVMGGAEARELGECAHAWLEALAQGLVLMKDVPEVVLPHVKHAHRVIAHRGLIMLPEYVERTVLNDQGEETVAGKLDCIFRVITTGELVLGDVKTSKGLDYSWLTYGVQIGGVYGWATKMLTTDGKGWEPMPEIRHDFAILLHVPSNDPAKAAAITIDMWWAGEVLVESLSARARRKEAPKVVPRHAIPTPSKEAVRQAEARIALSAITTADEGQAVYETYQDVWNDDLDEFGGVVAGLLS
ncbi:hypothetical protein Jolie1_044 [Mycobacterium phage Julie1]|uniref:Uncharacterized protein n=1 Tax=Mycobacterium phage Julie1 TaxID=1463812 RepID=W8EIQ4_9CAUD|nr:exonuclease [Mycobacterium phage Julie1]AHJ88544.1 hypothetical protein Jolie1_044 [Mycobacterium phage Julie1]